MKKEKILTISVAAYNLGAMIEENLEKISKAQNNELVEVIITDDGSKDDTEKYIKKYSENNPDVFKLIKQKNMGAGSTVNSGIKSATGKYFKMIDGDDWIETKDLERLLHRLEKCDADIVLTNYEIYDESKKKITQKCDLMLKESENKEFSDICKELKLNMYNVTIKTEILKKNNIKLDNGFYTDVEYLLLPIPYVKTVAIYKQNAYVYRVARSGQSVSITSMQKHIDEHDLVFSRLADYYEANKKNMNHNYKEFMKYRIACMAEVQLGTMLSMYGKKVKKSDIKIFIKRITELSKDIYETFSKMKKARILLKSNYIMTYALSKIYIIKNS